MGVRRLRTPRAERGIAAEPLYFLHGLTPPPSSQGYIGVLEAFAASWQRECLLAQFEERRRQQLHSSITKELRTVIARANGAAANSWVTTDVDTTAQIAATHATTDTQTLSLHAAATRAAIARPPTVRAATARAAGAEALGISNTTAGANELSAPALALPSLPRLRAYMPPSLPLAAPSFDQLQDEARRNVSQPASCTSSRPSRSAASGRSGMRSKRSNSITSANSQRSAQSMPSIQEHDVFCNDELYETS
eukprot:scaffold22630_cov29-Tisochrysis_lutea.AAC.7